MDLVGRMHRCVPMPGFAKQVIYGGSVGGGMTADVNNLPEKPLLLTRNATHQAKWRKANPELNRQRAREGMRKLRAANGRA